MDLRNDADFPQGSICAINENKLVNCFRFRKADYEDVWEKKFLVFLVPILKEAISYFETIKPLVSIALMKKSEV